MYAFVRVQAYMYARMSDMPILIIIRRRKRMHKTQAALPGVAHREKTSHKYFLAKADLWIATILL